MNWVNSIVQGVLVGGLYALFAAGLSLIFGVMRLVNIAHGDLIVLAAFVALVVLQTHGHQSAASRSSSSCRSWRRSAMCCSGASSTSRSARTSCRRSSSPSGSRSSSRTACWKYSPPTASASRPGGSRSQSFPIGGGIDIGVLPLLMFATAVVVIGGLQFIFYSTALGRAFRATSDDAEVARMMGLNNRHIFGLAMALSLAVVAIAGVFLAVRTNFDPSIGPARLIFGFEAVIIGGLGNIWGTLAGGVILGVAQAIGAEINPGWQVLAGHVVFLLVLAVRPKGLFPRVEG